MKKMLFFLLFLTAGSTQVFAQQKLKVGYGESGKAYMPVLAAIYKEAGLVPEFVLLPMERSLMSVDHGVIDADIGRAKGFLGAYPNLIETTESMLEADLLAVVRKDFKQTQLTPADLKNYRLGLVIGSKFAENLVSTLGMKAETADAPKSLFEMLRRNRFDVALSSSTAPLSMYPAYADTLITLPQPIYTAKVVHVMNRKWAVYVPRIDAAIKTMKADGRLDKLLAAVKP